MDLKIREEKMQEKRKNTPWREFVREICSRQGINFYKNNNYISRYPATERIKNMVSLLDFEKQRDGLTQFGRGYNFTKNFRENYQGLFDDVPLPAVVGQEAENSAYADDVINSKNAYLSAIIILGCENILYTFHVKENVKNVLNSVMVWNNSENVYMSVCIVESYNVFFSKYIHGSSDIRFSANLQGCHECLLSHNLQNKSYYIANEEYSKEEYLKEKEKILQDKQKFMQIYEDVVKAQPENIGSTSVVGNVVMNSENIDNGIFVDGTNNGRNIVLIGSKEGSSDMFDSFLGGSRGSTDFYGVINAGGASQNVYNSDFVVSCSNIYHSFMMTSCSYCLGCIGLKNKQFCILNKQYTKEERFELANKIFEQMDKDGTLGEFFPGSMNPFYFNDTVAYLIDDSFTKEEVTAEGYLRRDEEIKVDVPEGTNTIETKELNGYQGFDELGVWKINPEILKKVVKDEKGNLYRIVPMELEFLQKHGLPLPEIHRLERIKLGFKFK